VAAGPQGRSGSTYGSVLDTKIVMFFHWSPRPGSKAAPASARHVGHRTTGGQVIIESPPVRTVPLDNSRRAASEKDGRLDDAVRTAPPLTSR
jgi:hypothetical protein